MPSSSESDIRPLANRIVFGQMGAGVVVAVVCWTVWGRNALVSALAGAITGVVANIYMTLKALRPARTRHGALGQVYVGQLVKVLLTVAGLMLAARIPHISWPALLAAYAVTLMVFWWIPLVSAHTR